MDDEIQLVSDGDGITVLGEASTVERFLRAADLPSQELALRRLLPVVSLSSGVAEAAAQLSAHSGRWLQLTAESARKMDEYGLMKGSHAGLSRVFIQASNGQFVGHLEINRITSIAANPMLLTGLAGLMSQYAMQQQMREVTDYLAAIDAKVDDVLRSQKDAVLADLVGVDLVIDDAMTMRGEVGHVGEVTWSKVQATALTVARTQAYALRQLDAIADKLERKTDISELVKTTKAVEPQVREWLAVVAHCFRLQDALAVLELDRVLETAPADLDQHRLGLQVSRQNRLDVVTKTTTQLLQRIGGAASWANRRVLTNPLESPAVVRSTNRAGAEVVRFHQVLGVDHDDASTEARRWMHAAGDVRDQLLKKSSDGLNLSRRAGSEARDRARSLTNRLARGVAERTQPRATEDQD